MKFPCVRGNTSRGRWTACATDSSTREPYHGCLAHAGANKRTGREDARVLPSTAVSSGVGGKAYTPPGKTHMWDSASTPFALSSGKGDRKGGSCALRRVANRSIDIVGSRSKICLKRRGMICHSVERGLERHKLSAITFICDGM